MPLRLYIRTCKLNIEILVLKLYEIRKGFIMVQQFIFEHSNMCSIFLFGIISLVLQMIMVFSLNSYVKASANMKTTKKKVLINLKNQFETIYGMDYKVRNTFAYVEKYLLKLRWMGFSYNTWEKAPFLATGMVTLLAGTEAFYGYVKHVTLDAYVEIGFAYGIVLVCFYVFYHIFGVRNKKEQIQIQLVDYLENYLANRLLRTKNEDVKVLNESMEDAFMEDAVENERIRKEILLEEKEAEEKKIRESEKLNSEDADDNKQLEGDMDMLRRLIKEMEDKNSQGRRANIDLEDRKKLGDTVTQIAVSEEIPLNADALKEEEMDTIEDYDDSNLKLLEEFVQSFLA